MKEITKKYSNGEVTIVWKPSLCIHSGICFMGLPTVFKPSERPWITPEGSNTERIIAQVKRCPSGALSYYMNEAPQSTEKEARFDIEPDPEMQIEVRPNGPLVVKGKYTIKHKDGTIEHREKATSFCRCGHSKNKPFCDKSHLEKKFEE